MATAPKKQTTVKMDRVREKFEKIRGDRSLSQEEVDRKVLELYDNAPFQELNRTEQAMLVAARTRQENANMADKPKPKPDPKRMPSLSGVQGPGATTPEDAVKELQRERNMQRGEAAAKKQMGTIGFKKGGLVTPRGQGKVMRPRKARMC